LSASRVSVLPRHHGGTAHSTAGTHTQPSPVVRHGHALVEVGQGQLWKLSDDRVAEFGVRNKRTDRVGTEITLTTSATGRRSRARVADRGTRREPVAHHRVRAAPLRQRRRCAGVERGVDWRCWAAAARHRCARPRPGRWQHPRWRPPLFLRNRTICHRWQPRRATVLAHRAHVLLARHRRETTSMVRRADCAPE
jgi:hypothetical protein